MYVCVYIYKQGYTPISPIALQKVVETSTIGNLQEEFVCWAASIFTFHCVYAATAPTLFVYGEFLVMRMSIWIFLVIESLYLYFSPTILWLIHLSVIFRLVYLFPSIYLSCLFSATFPPICLLVLSICLTSSHLISKRFPSYMSVCLSFCFSFSSYLPFHRSVKIGLSTYLSLSLSIRI